MTDPYELDMTKYYSIGYQYCGEMLEYYDDADDNKVITENDVIVGYDEQRYVVQKAYLESVESLELFLQKITNRKWAVETAQDFVPGFSGLRNEVVQKAVYSAPLGEDGHGSPLIEGIKFTFRDDEEKKDWFVSLTREDVPFVKPDLLQLSQMILDGNSPIPKLAKQKEDIREVVEDSYQQMMQSARDYREKTEEFNGAFAAAFQSFDSGARCLGALAYRYEKAYLEKNKYKEAKTAYESLNINQIKQAESEKVDL